MKFGELFAKTFPSFLYFIIGLSTSRLTIIGYQRVIGDIYLEGWRYSNPFLRSTRFPISSSTRDYFQRERSHARCDWTTNGLSRGVTETGSAPQVPGYRWIHLSFLFHKPPFPFLCYFINLLLPSCLSSLGESNPPKFPFFQSDPFLHRIVNNLYLRLRILIPSPLPSKRGRGSRRKKKRRRKKERLGGPEAFVAKWSSREGRVINPADNAIDSGDIKMIYRPRLIVQYFMHAYKLRPAGFASGR